MHREWRHEVSEQWLMSRRACLTASDVRKLLPDLRRVESGKIGVLEAQQFAKVYGDKQSDDMDGMSFGAAARGHVMEPHAVDEYNAARYDGPEMYAWDDKLITDGTLGFSPDSLNIAPMKGTRFKSVEADGEWRLQSAEGYHRPPKELLEIKSYDAGTHYQRIAQISAGIPLAERWQVATAMAVCPSIEAGSLMFYAPQCNSMAVERYGRGDLEEEIEVVRKIGELWSSFRVLMDEAREEHESTTYKTEQEIYSRYLLDEMGR